MLGKFSEVMHVVCLAYSAHSVKVFIIIRLKPSSFLSLLHILAIFIKDAQCCLGLPNFRAHLPVQCPACPHWLIPWHRPLYPKPYLISIQSLWTIFPKIWQLGFESLLRNGGKLNIKWSMNTGLSNDYFGQRILTLENWLQVAIYRAICFHMKSLVLRFPLCLLGPAAPETTTWMKEGFCQVF